MKYIKDMKIGTKLTLLLSLVMIVIFAALGIYTVTMQSNQIYEDTDLRMTEQVHDLSMTIQMEIAVNNEKVDLALKLANQYLKNQGVFQEKSNNKIDFAAINQVNNSTINLQVNQWLLNDEQIQNNFTFVDAIKKMGIEVATIFQRIPQGYLRISTNVMTLEGQRAIGTFIPNSSPVAEAISSGDNYQGRAFVVNDFYQTSNKPIIIDGQIQGILAVGVPEKNMKDIRKIFQSKKYFDSGYPFMIGKNGDFFIHPTSEGKNQADAIFFKKMVAQKASKGKVNYMWEGRKKFLYYEHLDNIDAYIAVSIYEDELLSIVRHQRLVFFIAFILAIALFLAVNIPLTRSIARGIEKAMDFAAKVARGELDSTLEVTGKDEIGLLTQSLNNMVIELRKIVDNIISGADNISAASQQMSSTAEELSQSSNIQASSVEEISSTMEEITSNIQQNTDNALQTEKISNTTKGGLEKVTDQAQKATEATRSIAEKIQIINDIAFQTNILALNAAVEAARAGDHGRGFAVVAAEVRKLAERSKSAAIEIVDEVNKNLNLAQMTGQQMTDVLPDVVKSAELVNEIATGSLEQKNATEEVNSAIMQLNNLTQQNAAASEEMASSSEELASQADQLTDLMSFFKLAKEQGEKKNVKRESVKKEIKQKEKKKVSPSTNVPGPQIKLNIKDKDLDSSDYESF
ncbi:MAG: Cache 3/Cache 2 fusion domain-containing protein [Marinilabiliaceae bacterium]|nr:Cache 3/Cache 2 fusion domain-containing protein [Marinilabiliaceae bacterium]